METLIKVTEKEYLLLESVAEFIGECEILLGNIYKKTSLV